MIGKVQFVSFPFVNSELCQTKKHGTVYVDISLFLFRNIDLELYCLPFFLSCQIPSFREHILSSRLQLLNVLVSLCFKLLLEATYSPWLKGWKPILYHWKVVQNMVILINKLPCDCVLRAAIVGHEKRQALAWYSLYGRLQPLLHILILMPWMCWRDVPQRHTWIVEAEA